MFVQDTQKWQRIAYAKKKRSNGAKALFPIRMSRPKRNFPKRGEVWWINFDPSIGTESSKTRPAIIVSNDISNEFLERIQAVPITSNITKVYPSETFVSVRGKKNKAAADQIATVSKLRLGNKIGRITEGELANLEFVVKLQLGLS